MNEADKRGELERICGFKSIKPTVKLFLEWMGEQALDSGNFRVNSNAIHEMFFKDGGFDDDRQLSRNLVRDARLFVKNVYQKLPSTGVWISIPDKLPSESGKKGAYTLRFEEGERQTPYIPPVKTAQLGPSAAFWKRMIAPISPEKGMLVYPAEQPEFGKNEDDRGLYSGSGEVAAAFLIGTRTAHLNTVVETRRSKYVSQEELAVGNTWLVFLGSPFANGALRELREDSRWADMQRFHFEQMELGSVICKGALSGKPEKTFGYKVFAERRREEEHALISYLRDRESNQVLVAFAGLSTIGTWAAAKFFCDDACIQVLQGELSISPDEEVPSFEVLLKVRVSNYRPERITILDFQIHRD